MPHITTHGDPWQLSLNTVVRRGVGLSAVGFYPVTTVYQIDTTALPGLIGAPEESSVSVNLGTTPLPSEVREALAFFLSRTVTLPEVEAVTVCESEGVYIIRTYIARRDLEVREKIYEFEYAVASQFTHLRFDFYVLSLDGPVTSITHSRSTGPYIVFERRR
ncbi:MAG: hypothetical protein GTO55_11295 [Armatimonadetes bacterium]|nr:hypothetical protein [Armatimonadota bacterium]NIM68692.1 hypothetical protein [Armatimonadota bacterium]NIM76987.1 hypothetical protein [Armatimonadota bacterium]NIN06893.1 hypothetical protein [Armatimonadota bacterium]NIO75806.1 hypothetical protein [Armatimonadota bacterium]